MRAGKKIVGAIFDVDDTLLDNQPYHPLGGFHERSRYDAVLRTANKYGLTELASHTRKEGLEAFLNAKVHSVEGGVWGILYLKQLVTSEEIDPDHELLKEIVALKHTLHPELLKKDGAPVKGADLFVKRLAAAGLGKQLAIASSAPKSEIDTFLDEITDLRQFFPSHHVISKESIPYGQGKPHPEPFNLAFKTLGLPERERHTVLAVEDDPRGVASAKAAGLYVCAITTRFQRDDSALVRAEPDLIVDSFAELADALGLA
jgi:beta-phosphoglucomutase-like phosphatase (HAD superfamily)